MERSWLRRTRSLGAAIGEEGTRFNTDPESGRRSVAIAEIRDEIAGDRPGLEIATELVKMRPVDALIEVARACEVDAIAVGHGGAGPLEAALLGSITDEMVRCAPLPILVVPDDEDDID